MSVIVKSTDQKHKTEEEYQRFRKDFIEAVAPEMEKHRIARMKSEQESMFRFVN